MRLFCERSRSRRKWESIPVPPLIQYKTRGITIPCYANKVMRGSGLDTLTTAEGANKQTYPLLVVGSSPWQHEMRKTRSPLHSIGCFLLLLPSAPRIELRKRKRVGKGRRLCFVSRWILASVHKRSSIYFKRVG